MQNPPLPVIRNSKRFGVKIGKVSGFGGCLSHSDCQMQDLYPLCPPFTGGILAGRHPHFLSRAQAFRVAFTMFAGWDFVPKDNNGVRNLHAAQHSVPALHEDPAVDRRRVHRGIDDPAPKGTVSSGKGWRGNQQPERSTQYPAHLHTNSDAKLPGGVLS
jgi:hypothetical protein